MPQILRHKPLFWVFLMIFHISFILLILGHLDILTKFCLFGDLMSWGNSWTANGFVMTKHDFSQSSQNLTPPCGCISRPALTAGFAWRPATSKGQDVESTQAGFEEAVANIEPEVEELWPTPQGHRAIPMGVENADVLFVTLSGKHSIVPAAAILNAANVNWTLSSFEAVNFGAFLGDPE